MPGPSLSHVFEAGAYALVIGRTEPEHAGKHLFRIPRPAEAPQADTVAVETPEEGAVASPLPGEKTVEALTEESSPILTPMS